jgi:hypothetical protein
MFGLYKIRGYTIISTRRDGRFASTCVTNPFTKILHSPFITEAVRAKEESSHVQIRLTYCVLCSNASIPNEQLARRYHVWLCRRGRCCRVRRRSRRTAKMQTPLKIPLHHHALAPDPSSWEKVRQPLHQIRCTSAKQQTHHLLGIPVKRKV